MHVIPSAVVAALSLLCLTGCAHRTNRGDVPSFVAAGYSERRFASVAVLANFSDLRIRGTLERLMEEEFRGGKLRVVPCASLLFPDREHSQDETLAAARRDGVESLLILDPVESGEVRWIPFQIDDTVQTRSRTGDGAVAEEETTRTTKITTGRVVWHRIRARLVDLSTGKSVWLMDDTVRDFKLGSMERLVENAVEGLRETHVLGK